MKQIPCIFCLIAILVVFGPESHDAVSFRLTNFECESYNKTSMVINLCRLKVIKRNRIGGYFNGSFLHPVNEIFVRFRVFKKASGYKPWLIDVRIDGCRFMKNPYNPIARLIFGIFLEFTNINHECPFMGTQIVDGLYLKPELLKVPMPTGDYKLAIGWYYYNNLQFETNASFNYVENLIDQ